MNEYGCASFGFYFGTVTAAKRAHLAVSMGLFDPAAGFPGAPAVGLGGLSILAGFNTSIIGG